MTPDPPLDPEPPITPMVPVKGLDYPDDKETPYDAPDQEGDYY